MSNVSLKLEKGQTWIGGDEKREIRAVDEDLGVILKGKRKPISFEEWNAWVEKAAATLVAPFLDEPTEASTHKESEAALPTAELEDSFSHHYELVNDTIVEMGEDIEGQPIQITFKDGHLHIDPRKKTIKCDFEKARFLVEVLNNFIFGVLERELSTLQKSENERKDAEALKSLR